VAEGIDSLSTIGCFALTELGFGNNAVQMETTAHYDPKTKEFVINSPTVLSQKYWITNGAYHCNYALVFAQLYMPGDKHEGVHVFLVRMRNEDGSVRPGIFIEDMGAKFGCNG
jgi:acyl-CoA oxidase